MLCIARREQTLNTALHAVMGNTNGRKHRVLASKKSPLSKPHHTHRVSLSGLPVCDRHKNLTAASASSLLLADRWVATSAADVFVQTSVYLTG